MELGKCKKQKRVHCLTAERRLPKEKPAPEEGEDEESDEEADEELEDEADTEGEDATEEDRFVVEDQIWLCYATRDNCEQQRKNMYYFGFTNVSRCGKWK
jgi:poly-D-alanine transfer protein DltD